MGAAPGAAGRTPRLGARKLVVLGVVAVLIVGLALLGLMSFDARSPPIPLTHPRPSSVSFLTARQSADGVASGVGHGGFWPFSALGVASATAFELPGPEAPPIGPPPPTPVAGTAVGPPPIANNSSSSPCSWTALGGSSLLGIAIPSDSAAIGSGLSSAWLFAYVNASGSVLFVTVLNGSAAPYALAPPPDCSNSAGYGPGGSLGSIDAGVIDSTSAAAIADQWGASAFLSNVSASIGIFQITPPSPSTYYPPGGVSYPAPSISPATWSIGYSSCNTLATQGYEQSLSYFDATLNAASGAVESTSATLGTPGPGASPDGCIANYPPPCLACGPPGPGGTPLGADLSLSTNGTTANCTGAGSNESCQFVVGVVNQNISIVAQDLDFGFLPPIDNGTNSSQGNGSLARGVSVALEAPGGCTLALFQFTGMVGGNWSSGGAGACTNSSVGMPLLTGDQLVVSTIGPLPSGGLVLLVFAVSPGLSGSIFVALP